MSRQDERQTYLVTNEICRWRETVTSRFTPVEVVGSEAFGTNRSAVSAQLEGDVSGSPMLVKFRFVLREELMEALEIGG